MPTPSQALVLSQVNAPFQLQDIIVDDPLDDEVLVKMVACGLCHSYAIRLFSDCSDTGFRLITDVIFRDIGVQQGHLPARFPCILGHEGAGVVLKTGSQVKKLVVGDHVLLSFRSCQTCGSCQRDEPVGCENWLAVNFGFMRTDEKAAPACKSELGQPISAMFFGQSSFSRHALASESSVGVSSQVSPLNMVDVF
jgi:aryl-alcohol dehydrogenase